VERIFGTTTVEEREASLKATTLGKELARVTQQTRIQHIESKIDLSQLRELATFGFDSPGPVGGFEV
jgi:hypothetical protein